MGLTHSNKTSREPPWCRGKRNLKFCATMMGKPYLSQTGIQRLLQDLDELPMPSDGVRCIEPAHRQATLKPKSWSLKMVRKKAFMATLVSTHGCRFNCDFCPIPAYQQRTWRHKSPERLAEELKQLA